MVKFNYYEVQAFRDFLELQNKLKEAQTSYESAQLAEQLTDTIMGMGMMTGAVAQKHYTHSRNRKLLLVGMVLAGGAYLYNKIKTKKQVKAETEAWLDEYEKYKASLYADKKASETKLADLTNRGASESE